MQKKSLLVALFCGALCLTGCLKNEESASVALVRGAKAEELKSLAALNNAKAAAEAVYAEAELTVAKAEAELRKAQAALILAQAETEKVRAELLKVRVALAEVEVEEEKVKLQKMEAELEQKLAEVEAAVAKAEREKQKYINDLENLLAQAEVDAIRNTKRVLEAEEKLEEYVLTLEKAHADSAKAAAAKYFAALEDVQDLQKQQLQIKATKALVEAGALKVRDAIRYEMEQIDEQIAENQARIDYLKEYQTMTPEEVEAKLEEAWKTLNDAYAAYLDASGAVTTAQTASKNADKVQSVYTEKYDNLGIKGWNDRFGQVVKDVLDVMGEGYAQKDHGRYQDNVFVDEETGVQYNAAVVLDEEGKEVVEVIPLWTASIANNIEGVSDKEQVKEGWLIPEVIDGIIIPRKTGTLANIKTRTYYPAKIEFDNIEEIFDAYKEYQEEVVLKNFDDSVAAYTERQKEIIEARVAGWKTAKEYFEDYIANADRAAMVEKAEKAIADSIPEANKTYNAENKAFEAYRDYMVMKYDVNRSYFENRYNAKNASVAADTDSTDYVDSKLPYAKSQIADLFKDLKDAELLFHEKAGAKDKAVADYNAALTGEAAAIADAKKAWNPDFKPFKKEGSSIVVDTVWVGGKLYNGSRDPQTETPTYDESTKAGTSQVNTATAKTLLEEKEKALSYAQWLAAYYTGMGNTEAAAAETAKIPTLTSQYDAALISYNGAVKAEAVDHAAYDAAAGKVAAAFEVKTAAETALQKAIADLYPAVGEAEPTTWDKFVAAVKDTLEVSANKPIDISLNFYPRQISVAELTLTPIPENATAAEVKASTVYTTAQKTKWLSGYATRKANDLKNAEAALLRQLALHMNVDPEEIETTEDETADSLYAAWREAQRKGDVSKRAMDTALRNLMWVYYFCADQSRRGWFENEFYWANATYQVDPEHQLISGYHWDAENETYVLEYSYRRTTLNDEGEVVADREHSLGGLIEDTEAYLADKEEFAKDCKDEYLDDNNMIDPHDTYADMLKRIKEANENLAECKSVEPAYLAAVKNRNTAYAAYVEAQIAEVVAKVEYTDAKEAYNALKDIQNEGIWVYDDGGKVWAKVKDLPGAKQEDKFTFVPITKAIEDLEGDVDAYKTGVSALFTIAVTVQNQIDNVIDGKKVTIDELQSAYEALKNIDKKLPDGSIAELNFTKKVLEETLKAGKVSLQIIIDAFDEQLAVLDEKIEVYTALVNTYKAIMNAYLGIVEESEGETGPLDGEGEGDDEE